MRAVARGHVPGVQVRHQLRGRDVRPHPASAAHQAQRRTWHVPGMSATFVTPTNTPLTKCEHSNCLLA